jgi:hypothetical protein
VYEWIKDLPLGRPRSNPGQAKGVAAMQAKHQRLRDEAYAQGLAEFETLAAQPTFQDFVVLHIAEGYKRDRNCVAICDSDGAVMAFAHRWVLRLSTKRLGYAVQYHADQELEELRSYWGETLGIDGSEITVLRKSNSGMLKGRIWRSEFGVLTVRASDTYLRARLQGVDRSDQARLVVRLGVRLGAWRSLVTRTVWVGENPGSNPGAPIVVQS